MALQLYLTFVMIFSGFMFVIWGKNSWANVFCKAMFFFIAAGALFFLMQLGGHIVKV